MVDLFVKPVIIFSYAKEVNQEIIQPILNGLEEEGIPFLLEEKEIMNINAEAYVGAVASSLQVGICCDEEIIVIHHKNLKEDEPYMMLTRYQTRPKEQLKNFGANAARLVKGIPFKVIE